jgi:hypothetical protein
VVFRCFSCWVARVGVVSGEDGCLAGKRSLMIISACAETW